jgi:ArpU family phage transcriptional regulator
MARQISFELPEIDRKLTREEVEKHLEMYRVLLITQPEEKLPMITQQYSLTPRSITNAFSSSTESSAIENVDRELFIQDYIKRTNKAINRLPRQERAIIIKNYCETEHKYNYEIYNELGMSERHYNRIKGRAFYNLALILRLEVYIEDGLVKSS